MRRTGALIEFDALMAYVVIAAGVIVGLMM